uniref:Protein kinase domain-containing protein n=1 Tax=Chlamydomonas euryale TaxID=1486919 RepID=A0A7R9YSM5_9CHLO|mmetsp:Transcript_16186/g.48170  ORF Transcript_16186/g.48170 Transcript_16186/m.48170 type:complete len:613 (+) Transcript_16186:95-1933(+)
MGCVSSTPLHKADGQWEARAVPDVSLHAAGAKAAAAAHASAAASVGSSSGIRTMKVGGGGGASDRVAKSAFSNLASVAYDTPDSPLQEYRPNAIATTSSLRSAGSRSCRVSLHIAGVDDEGCVPPGTPSRTSSRATSRQSSFKGTNRALSFRLANMVEEKSGTLTRVVSRSMSNISNCSMKEGEGPMQGTVMLCDNEQGDAVTIKKQIGKGGFGRVYLGTYGDQQVAIKAVFGERALNLPGMDQDDAETQERRERMIQLEALLMSMLSGHENIVHTYKCLASWRDLGGASGGVVPDACGSIQYEWFIVMEYCSEGSLWDNLMTATFHGDADPLVLTKSPGLVRWDAWASLELLKEVARALQFLHDNGVVHGDLKAANVLMAESMLDRRGWEAKVTDFGFARIVAQNHVHTKAYGTVTHMPPELLERGLLTTAADIFSFGMLMWEVFMAQGLYKDLSDGEVVAKVVKERARPNFLPGCPLAFQQLAARCWTELPEARPTASEVEDALDELQRVMCPAGPDNEWLLVPGSVPGHRRRKPTYDESNTAALAAQRAIAAVHAEQEAAAAAAAVAATTRPGAVASPKKSPTAARGISPGLSGSRGKTRASHNVSFKQ